LPTIVTRVSTSGPLPISVAPLTGARDLAVLDQVGLARREHELAAGDVDLAAAEVHGVEAPPTERMISSGSCGPGQHVGVRHARHRRVREGLAPAVAGRRTPIRRAFSLSCM
jgi:hypothetical protein